MNAEECAAMCDKKGCSEEEKAFVFLIMIRLEIGRETNKDPIFKIYLSHREMAFLLPYNFN